MAISEDAVREELKKVIDPELFVNIVDLGLIYVVNLEPQEDERVKVLIEMTMTSPACPAGPQLIANSKSVVSQMGRRKRRRSQNCDGATLVARPHD